MMKLLSVNVGEPRVFQYRGEEILSGIFKAPVAGPVAGRQMNIEGDGQADLTVHGGKYKAVYAYPSEHYSFWRKRYPRLDLPWGALGENLTTTGLAENKVYVGDRLRIGTAIFQVTQPRLPCFKLAARFDDDGIIQTFMASRRSGIYLAVEREGTLEAGDEIEFVYRHPAAFSIADAQKIYIPGSLSREMLERALSTPLPPGLARRAEDQLP